MTTQPNSELPPLNPSELEKAIEELSSFGKDVEVTQDMIDVCKTLDIALSAAKRTASLEQEIKYWKTGFDAEAHRGDDLYKQLKELKLIAEKMYEALRNYLDATRASQNHYTILAAHDAEKVLTLAQQHDIGKDKK